jgi:hypothetical protein
MATLSALVGEDGGLRVSGGPVRARCFGWRDLAQDERMVVDAPLRRAQSERGLCFEGRVELDGLRVARVERLGAWSALLLPAGSRLLVEAQIKLPELRMPPPAPQPSQPAARPAPEPMRNVARLVLALVLLDIFGR